MPKISVKLKRGHPKPKQAPNADGARSRLNAGALAANWRILSVFDASVVNLVWSRVYHTKRQFCLQHIRRDTARRVGLSATADFCITIGD